jgi:hypothetical protein
MWDNELAPAGTLSRAFVLERINRSFYPYGLSFEVSFASNPGVFEIDLMGANTDNAAYYISLGSITSTNNGYGSIFTGYVGRWDMPSNNWPKYVAGYVKTLTNAVAVTLTVNK